MAETSTHYEQMKDFVRTEIAVLLVKNRQLHGILLRAAVEMFRP